MHLYVPWAIQDLHASIRPLGRIGFSGIYTSLGPYRIYMHLYVPWAVQDFQASIRPLGHIGFTCIYTSLGSFRRPIWPDKFCKFHPLRGLYNRGRGIYLNMFSYLYPLVAVTTIHMLSRVGCLYCPIACMSLYGVRIPGQYQRLLSHQLRCTTFSITVQCLIVHLIL